MREFVEARLDELLHGRGLVYDALHDVVDRLDLNGSATLAQLFLVRGTQQCCSTYNNVEATGSTAFER